MKSKTLLLLVALTLSSVVLAQEGKINHVVDDKDTKTDMTLLKDGSEKKHVTKKTKGTPTPAPTPAAPSTSGLPTDVD